MPCDFHQGVFGPGHELGWIRRGHLHFKRLLRRKHILIRGLINHLQYAERMLLVSLGKGQHHEAVRQIQFFNPGLDGKNPEHNF